MKQMTQYLVGIFVVSVAFIVLVAPQSRAESFSWLLGDKTVSAGESTPSPYEAFPDCQNQEVFIGTATTTRTSICVYRQDGFRYGIWYDKRVLVVGFPNESRMYVVEGVPPSVIYTPGSKDMVIPLSSYPYGSRDLYIVRDFTSKLVRTLTPDLSVSYRLPFEVYTPMFHEADGGVGKITQVGVSRNGEWLAFETYAGDGFALINIKTLELKWFSHYEPSQIVGVWGKTEFSISDDGRRVATAGRWVDVRMYELSDSCGSPFIDGVQHRDAAECPYVSLWSQVATAINNDMDFPMSPRLDRAGGKLTVYAVPIYRSEKPQDARWVTVTAQGYSPTQLEYLALGDSYSSGEGDTEINPITKTKYYLPGTDVKGDKTTPTEKCHISSRSYPYVLKTSMYLSDMTMKSVTCSGAVTGDMSGSGSYLGQGGRLGEFPTITKSLQDQAINNDIPGRIRQIDFVKKYQPAVITLTAGGNDVHFSDVIKSCVLSPFYTCSYAHSNDGKAIIALEIMGLYEKLVTLYKDIHTASPKTKIYVVGYPQFISNRSSLLCAPNVVLNDAERTMVHESVVYINRVIKAAAHTVGVKYLDIEDSLGGHALCGGQQAYVTGVSARGEFGLLSFGSKSEQQESFHPNAKGNKAIADTIQAILGKDKTLLTYNFCPNTSETVCPVGRDVSKDPPDYFKEALLYATKKYMAALLTTDNYVQKGSDLSNFKINFSGLEAGSSAQLEVHSTPTSLGAYTVGETGQLSVSVPVPDNLSAGYHTLHLIGKTTSGEDVDLWQIIEVRGRAGDIDEDGIPDDIDPCIYVPASGLDADVDGIDDACDAEIGEPPERMLAYQDKVAVANSLRVHANRPLQMESNVDHFAIVPMMDFANENAALPTAGSSVQDLRSASPVGSIVVSVVAAAGLAGLTWFIWVKIKNRKYYEK